MPQEMVAVWTVFTTIYSFVALLDFGFNPSFTRNVTYVFSGVKSLKSTGYEVVDKEEHKSIDYGLLKGLIAAMRFFYRRMALIALLILLTLGSYYIYSITQNYRGPKEQIYISWLLLSVITCYTLYTYYYDSLIQGAGLITKDKQINMIGQILYLTISIALLSFGYQIISIVVGQAVSVVVMRVLLYRTFFTKEISLQLNNSTAKNQKDILKAIYPNAVKIGITSFGAVLVTRSALIIGSLYLSLKDIASYGITMQLISVIGALASIYVATFQPKIVALRIAHDNNTIKKIYGRGIAIMLVTFLLGGFVLIFIGPLVLEIIGSNTPLMVWQLTLLALVGYLIEINVSMAGTILLTKNYVPFFKASLLSGTAIVVGILLCFKFFDWGVFTIIIVPIVVTLVYQGWKWPYEAQKDLRKDN